MHAARVEREMQAVRVPVPAAELATLETHVPVGGPEDREPLGLEQDAARRPGGRVTRKLRGHEEQRPPRQRATGNGKRDRWQRRVMQVGLEQLWSDGRRLVQSREPTLKFTFPVSRFPLPEVRESDLPQLEVRRLRQGPSERRVFPRRKREVRQRGAGWGKQGRLEAPGQLSLRVHVDARLARPRRSSQQGAQREQVVVLSLVPHAVPPEPACQMLEQARGPFEDRKSTRLNSSHRCISYAVFCLKKKKRKK